MKIQIVDDSLTITVHPLEKDDQPIVIEGKGIYDVPDTIGKSLVLGHQAFEVHDEKVKEP